MRYCEQYVRPEGRLDLDPATRFQKNHDFDLDTPVKADRQYLVQIRYPLDSLVSLFKLNVEQNGMPDTPASWTNFAVNKTGYWMRFYKKWVLDHVEHRMVVNYTDLVADPAGVLTRVVGFLGDERPDTERINAICAAEDIRVRHDYRCFKHYGAQFFALLKGFFCAVPGVDVEADRLIVPHPDVRGVGRLAEHMRAVAERMTRLATEAELCSERSRTESTTWSHASFGAVVPAGV